MIADIKTRKDFGRVIDYSINKGEESYHIDDNISPFELSASEAIKTMNIARRANAEAKEPVFHASINFAPEDKDKVTDKLMVEIGQRYLRDMDFDIDSSDNNRNYYVMFRHLDTQDTHEHFHIVASRINLNGNLVDLHQSINRSRLLMRQYEKEYGLRVLSNEKAIIRSTTKSERELKKRIDSWGNDFMPGREKILNHLRIAFSKSPKLPLKVFLRELNENGIDVKFNTDKQTTKISGISFMVNLDGFKFLIKGSSLGKQYSWNGLKEKLIIEMKTDKELIEQSNRTITFSTKDQYRYLKESNDLFKKRASDLLLFRNEKPSADLKEVLAHCIFSHSDLRTMHRKIKVNGHKKNFDIEELIMAKFDTWKKRQNIKIDNSIESSNLNLSNPQKEDLKKQFVKDYYSFRNYHEFNNYIRGYRHPFIQSEIISPAVYIQSKNNMLPKEELSQVSINAIEGVVGRERILDKMNYIKRFTGIETLYNDEVLTRIKNRMSKPEEVKKVSAILNKVQGRVVEGSYTIKPTDTFIQIIDEFDYEKGQNVSNATQIADFENILPKHEEIMGYDNSINYVDVENRERKLKKKKQVKRRGLR